MPVIDQQANSLWGKTDAVFLKGNFFRNTYADGFPFAIPAIDSWGCVTASLASS